MPALDPGVRCIHSWRRTAKGGGQDSRIRAILTLGPQDSFGFLRKPSAPLAAEPGGPRRAGPTKRRVTLRGTRPKSASSVRQWGRQEDAKNCKEEDFAWQIAHRGLLEEDWRPRHSSLDQPLRSWLRSHHLGRAPGAKRSLNVHP